SPAHRGALAEAARMQARGFVMECRAIAGMFESAPHDQREFVHGDVAGTLHLAPRTALDKLTTALDLMAQPRLVAALEQGRLGVGHAIALLHEISHLSPPVAAQVLAAVLGDGDEEIEATAGELRTAAKKAAITVDADAARKRHEEAKKSAGVRGRPTVDGMGQVVTDCTATQAATIVAAVRQRAEAMTFDDPELTEGQKQVAALLHALGCERVGVQAVLECPVERAVDLNAAAQSGVWGIDVRMPVAVALGLSDHPALLVGYGPIGADEARALLPCSDLVRACVDAGTGEVLAVDRPVPRKAWQAGDPDLAAALRRVLVEMATSGGTIPDLTTDGYVPSEALGRLVDLRDVTSVFPGDATAARRSERDHRLPYPLGPTADWNLQNLVKRWHRAKHNGWHTRLLADGTIEWTSPSRGVYHRKPKRTVPPKIPPDGALPPIPGDSG
ncbi:MAG: hypothetical protein WD794_08575, partial [Mycobacteriales bacterium]